MLTLEKHMIIFVWNLWMIFFNGKDGFATTVIGSVSSFPFIFHLYCLCSNSPIDERRVQVSHLQMKPFLFLNKKYY